jgi:transforming growth factor-beta-induced protein
LQPILLYLVVLGKVMSTYLKATVQAEAPQGATVEIVKAQGWTEKQRAIIVNGANVISGNLEASNGVIHVIDAVILPP